MPSKDRVRGKQRANLFEHLASKYLASGRQPPPLVIVQQYTFRTKFLFEDLILGPEVLDDLLLLAIDPAGEDHEVQLTRLKDEIHERAVRVKVLRGPSPSCAVACRSTDMAASVARSAWTSPVRNVWANDTAVAFSRKRLSVPFTTRATV